MDTNNLTMYLTIGVLAILIINNLYKQVAMFIAKSKGAVYHRISQDEAKQEMDGNRNIVILDVRTPNEYQTGHIRKAKNISNMNEVQQKYPDKDTKLFVYCQSGGRSVKAARKLVMKGYKEVYDLGGLSYWNYGTTKK